MGWFYSTTATCLHGLFRLFYRHETYGAEHLHQTDGALIAANHASVLDPPLIAASSPTPVHFVAREDLFHSRLFGALIRLLNAHPIRGLGNNVSSIRTVIQLLKEGDKVVLFPEGSRTHDGTIQPIEKGIALIAHSAEASVIPCYLHGTFDIWNRTRKYPLLRGKTACVFGSPIHWQEFAHLPKREARDALLKRMEESIHALKAWYDAGAKGSPP